MTTAVACGWMIGGIYGILGAAAAWDSPAVGQMAASTLVLLVAFAALERWRWSRLALFGMSAMLLLDLLCGAIRLASAKAATVGSTTIDAQALHSLLAGPHNSPVFGALAISLSVATIAWTRFGGTMAEFNYRKRTRTRRMQGGIAAAVVSLFFVALSLGGYSRGVSQALSGRRTAGNHLPATRQEEVPVLTEALHAGIAKRVALRPPATNERVERR